MQLGSVHAGPRIGVSLRCVRRLAVDGDLGTIGTIGAAGGFDAR
jgi:hypothetical protein